MSSSRVPGLVTFLSFLVGCAWPAIDESRLDAAVDVPPLPDAPVADVTLDRAIDVIALEAALGWAFGDDLDTFMRASVRTEDNARVLVSSALARERLAAPADCVTSSWVGTTATLTFAGCALGVGGGALEGTLEVEVVAEPASLRFSLGALSVRGSTIEGSLELRPGEATRPDVFRIFEGTASFVTDGRPTSIMSRGTVAIWNREASLGIWFQGTWSSDGRSDDYGGRLGWRPEACLPWEGTWSFAGAPFVAQMWLSFLEGTPRDGMVFGATSRLSCR